MKKILSLFGEIPEPENTKSGICQRDFKRNKCTQCGDLPKIHRTNAKTYYCKCHGHCCHWGFERKTAEFRTPQEAVDCWNKNNPEENK